MVNRTLIIAVVVTGSLSASIAGVMGWQLAGSRTCTGPIAPAQSPASNGKHPGDFFKSEAPPLAGGQEMRPRW
jgi:hypothetical protein